MMKQELPVVELYSIDAKTTDAAASLLTAEAVAEIKSGGAFGLALMEEDEVRAAACARIAPESEEVLELLSLYVPPAFRRRALGGTLLMELLEESMTATDGSLHWAVATFTPETEGIEGLLAKAGFQMEQEEQVVSWRLPVSDLAESPLLQHSVPKPAGDTLHPLEEVPKYILQQLAEELEKNEVPALTVEEMQEAMRSASFVLLNSEGHPKGCAFLSKTGEDSVCLSQFFAADGNAAVAMTVLQAAGRAALQQFPGETVLEIPTLTESSANLVKKLIPSSQATHLVRAVLELS